MTVEGSKDKLAEEPMAVPVVPIALDAVGA